MGVYVYSLRAKTIALTMPFGEKLHANMFSFAYRLANVWPGDRGYHGYMLTVENTDRNADNEFKNPDRSGVVVVGDYATIKSGKLEGHAVYTDVTAATWVDTEKFPGTFIGWIAKAGKGYRVADHTKWSDVLVQSDGGDSWIPMRSRSVLVGNKIEQERVIVGSEEHLNIEASELIAERNA